MQTFVTFINCTLDKSNKKGEKIIFIRNTENYEKSIYMISGIEYANNFWSVFI